MRKFFTRLIQVVLFIITPGLLVAQKDYNILLNAGKFLPEENTSSLTKASPVFQKSLYGNTYYVMLQFNTLPDAAMKSRLNAAGIQLIDYIPNNAYTATVPAGINLDAFKAFGFRSVFQLTKEQKTVPALLNGAFPAYAVKQPGYVDVTVITYEKLATASISSSLSAVNATILEDMPMFRSFTVRIGQLSVQQLVDLPFVQWVEFVDPPNQVENTLGRTLHRVNILNDGIRNLKGDGINVGIWDEGEISPHLDFSPAGRLNQVEFSSASQHSTHCAGTILGRGLINQTARGMAPNATLYSFNFSGNIQTEMANAIPTQGLVVSSHSYGSTQTCGLNGAGVTYNSTSRATDINLNTFPTHLHIHSSGNSQAACTGGWSTITASGKSSKNNILVANITTSEALSGSSSCGPVQDGRVKPEISAFGTSVFSTSTPVNGYATLSGTSMATPGVAGSVTLLVQRYKQLNSNNLPPSTLIKNTVLNTAQDLGNAGPDYRFGYGRINALEAVRILEENRYALSTVTTGVSNDMTVNVPAGTARLRVMLTWNDPAGAANANPALVNNLDLTVINGATTTLPWILDPNNPGTAATRGVDNVSNIEQVTIDNPPAGSYTLRVNGTAVPTGPGQDYALTWSVEQPYIEVIYPNGNETLNPGTNETITWNNAGLTGNQTVEYSLNNGASWNIISNVVAASVTRLAWSVPAGANTSTALIRISSGALTDVSDATFKILGTTNGFSGSGVSCNAGEVIFNWTAVINATHYDIYRLDAATGQFIVLAANITGTTYTATGLTPNASMWFTIRAKNNTTAAESERANAINVTVSNGGGGLGAVGSITGQNIICGAATNVTYTIAAVSGASSYIWTAPPGAIISAGQGTTTVTIDYPGGSSSGNVTAAASNGTCQTAASSLSITVSGSAVNAPASGGDQSVTVCPGSPVPTLTATATVAAGHTVIWYTAASGGSAISSPALSAAGSITYYAASRNTTTGCESSARTAVVLTITTVPAASVTAGGVTTFCQGGSVVLTANAGSSYTWSNGATTQSITVSTTGTYSVTVVTSGCSNTSPATNVTVNPLPTATISANGPTAFCDGNNVILTAATGSSYAWSNGATTSSITVSTSGNYSVTVTNASGCSATSTATAVAVSPRPVVTIAAAPYTRLYPGISTTLTSTVTPAGTVTYTWLNNGIPVAGGNAATLPVTLDQLGSYSLSVVNAGGCSNTSNVVAITDSATTQFYIYPNPNNGLFTVSYYNAGGNTTNTITVYDSKGAYVFRKAYAITSSYERLTVDLRMHGKGIYWIVMTDTKGKRLAAAGVIVQ